MTKLLDSVNTPEDLKKLTIPELKQLAIEIREFIIEVVSKKGGHLASSLGVVELTLALLKNYSPPQDKIIWDVSHQAYAYKIVTERKEKFRTLREFGGISGFTRREESEYDTFGTGHSSTSISAAAGIAFARDLKKEKFGIAAVIGDGSMTGGMVYEAFNNLANIKSNLLIILNDNEMSIASNVGAMAKYFNRLITGNFYNIAKDDIEDFITKRFTTYGKKFVKLTHKVEESIKGLILPGAVFEEFGIRYFGPIDGHNLDVLVPIIERLKSVKGPVLLHTMTKKGKGYLPSEEDPEFFHSAPSFVIETGEPRVGYNTYTEVVSEAICELAEEDKDIVAITAAMSSGTGLSKFSRIFPERFVDVGIAEQHAVTAAAGMATQGIKPVVAIYSTFLQRAFDQIIHDVALQNLPVVFCIDRGGIVGADGPTHHGVFDLSYLRMIPNMMVMSPKDGKELRNMLYTAVNHAKGPIAIRYPRGRCEEIEPRIPFETIPIGEPEELLKGENIAILAMGHFVSTALKVAKILSDEYDMSITVVNARFVKPINVDFIKNIVAEHKLIYTVEDNVVAGGFGSGINEIIDRYKLGKIHCKILGFPDKFIEHGAPEILYEKYSLTPPKIAQTIVADLKTHHLLKGEVLKKVGSS